MFVKVTNGTAESYTIGQLRRDNPQVSFPKSIDTNALAQFDVYPASVADEPSYDDRTQFLQRSVNATDINGVWTYTWTVASKSQQEIDDYDSMQAQFRREERDAKLAETDYLGLSDATMSAAMTTYRQALRDITSHANFPNLQDADWPTKP